MHSICFITRTSSWGGTEKHTANLIEFLLSRQYEIELVCSRHNMYADYIKKWKNTVRIVFNDLDIYAGGFGSQQAWADFLCQIQSDRLILPKGGPYFGSFDFLKVCRNKFSKIYFIEHSMKQLPPRNPIAYLRGWVGGDWKWWHRDALSRVSRAVYADHAIAVSNKVKESLIKHNKYPEDKITVVENGIDWWNFQRNEGMGRQFKNQHHLPPECFVFGMVTRLDRIKGVDVAIDAFAELLKANNEKKVYLVIVGQGNEKERLQQQVELLKIKEFVIFINFLKDPLPAFSACDVLLLPSRMEGLPFSLLEGMAAGCIPIVSRVGGMPRVIDNGVDGVLVEPVNKNVLCGAMREILCASPERLSAMRNQAAQKIKNQYDQNKSCEEILSIISAS